MFAPGYFAKSYFPGTYFPPPQILDPACRLAQEVLIYFQWETTQARHYLVTRAIQELQGRSGWRRKDPIDRKADAKLLTRAALCLDPSVDSWVLEELVRTLKLG